MLVHPDDLAIGGGFTFSPTFQGVYPPACGAELRAPGALTQDGPAAAVWQVLLLLWYLASPLSLPM